MKETRDGFLKPRKLADGRRYAVHAVDLGGHGVRDMCWDGERLLILSGATTDLTSLQSVWTLDRFDPGREVWEAGRVGRELDLPALRAADNAEGIALLGERRVELIPSEFSEIRSFIFEIILKNVPQQRFKAWKFIRVNFLAQDLLIEKKL